MSVVILNYLILFVKMHCANIGIPSYVNNIAILFYTNNRIVI